MGVNYDNRFGAKAITDHLGETMLKKLIRFVKGNRNPLAITVDETTGKIHI